MAPKRTSMSKKSVPAVQAKSKPTTAVKGAPKEDLQALNKPSRHIRGLQISLPPATGPRRYQLCIVLEEFSDGEVKVQKAECKKVDGETTHTQARQPLRKPTVRSIASQKKPSSLIAAGERGLVVNKTIKLAFNDKPTKQAKRVCYTASTKPHDGPVAAKPRVSVLRPPAPKKGSARTSNGWGKVKK